jgi:hypothetical protein
VTRRFRAGRALVGALVLVLLAAATAAAAPTQVLLKDNFRQGLDLQHTWALLSFPPFFIADDANVSGSPAGLLVAAKGSNPTTGLPAFTKASDGDFDHVKWMADTQHLSSNGVPGYDAVAGKTLSCTMTARGATFGTAAQPFGSAVADPASDLRLAAYAMNTIDFETSLVFDTWITSTAIYPYYERLNLTGTATYDAFTSVFPPIARTPAKLDTITLAYNRSAGTVQWIINGQVAATVHHIGFKEPGAKTLIDHGGTETAAEPRQLNCGMALFSLMDGGPLQSGPATGPGLVQLAPPYTYPTSWVGDGSQRLFGQGAAMQVQQFEIGLS